MRKGIRIISLISIYVFEFFVSQKYIFHRPELLLSTIIIFSLSTILFVVSKFKKIRILKIFMLIDCIGILSFLITFIFVWHDTPLKQQLSWIKNFYTYIFILIYILFSLIINVPVYLFERLINRKTSCK